MARKQVNIGSMVGFHVFDDIVVPDAIYTDGPIKTTNSPVDAEDVLRLDDLGSIFAPADSQYLVSAFDATLTNERRLVAGNGLASTDGGAGSDFTLDIDLNELGVEPGIASGDFLVMVDITDNGSQKITFANLEAALNHDALTNFVAAEHINWNDTSNANDLFTSGEIGISNTSPYGKLDVGGMIRTTGSSAPGSAAGKGAEIAYIDDTIGSRIFSYDRTGAARKPITLDGSDVMLSPGGTTKLEVDTTGFGVFAVTPAAQQAHISDAEIAHSLTDAGETVDRSEIEGMLNAIGTKINSLISIFETFGFKATS